MYGKANTLVNFIHTCVLCGGNLYIQYFDSILKLVQSKLCFITKIPNWKSYEYSSQHSRMFALEDRLLVHNNNGSVYILKDCELKFMKSISGRFYHFCGKLYVWKKMGALNDSYIISGISMDIEGQMQRNREEDVFLAVQRQNTLFQYIFAFTEKIIFYKMEFQNKFLKTEKEFEKMKNAKIIFTENNTKLNKIIF
ncbi:Hypothetical_protein [Hexamita inflata]|uniref:Hypothetical_protein n=1 Tax=Hexamita inflata TaxID=28002 RepID=A0AA86NP71_9EUKA|nr:Hypothetical protein HINF_LOCUS10223 [Hexamita inflata]